MKKKTKIYLGILSFIISAGGILTGAYYVKNKFFNRDDAQDEVDDSYKEMDEDDDFFVQDEDGFEYGFFEFESVEEMNKAINSNIFNIDAYYEVDRKGYLIILLDGNEDMIYKYNARRLNQQESNILLEKTEVQSMYFGFNNEDNLLEFAKIVSRIINSKNKFQIVIFQDYYYFNASELNKKYHNKIRDAAVECYGREVDDMFIANRLKECFDMAK